MRERADSKGVSDLLGKNLSYLLRLCQVADHNLLLPVWKELSDSPKRQQLTTLHHIFDDMAQWMGVCAPIITAPSLLRLYLTLIFRLNHRDDPGTGLHQFCLGQNTYVTWKVTKACVEQHQVVAGGVSALTLADASHLTAPDRVTFPETVAMVQISHTRLRVGLDTLLGRNPPATQGMEAVVLALI